MVRGEQVATGFPATNSTGRWPQVTVFISCGGLVFILMGRILGRQRMEEPYWIGRTILPVIEVTYNDITDIKVQSEDRDFYKITYVTATDSDGRQFTIRMFGHDNNQTKVEVE